MSESPLTHSSVYEQIFVMMQFFFLLAHDWKLIQIRSGMYYIIISIFEQNFKRKPAIL